MPARLCWQLVTFLYNIVISNAQILLNFLTVAETGVRNHRSDFGSDLLMDFFYLILICSMAILCYFLLDVSTILSAFSVMILNWQSCYSLIL